MIAVSNTSPICYLVLIGAEDLLPALFESVFIPTEVQAELLHRAAPAVIREWLGAPPQWLIVDSREFSDDSDLVRLDPGERAAIQLAESLRADFLLIDERNARQVAEGRCLRLAGTLGILSEGASRGLIDLPAVVDRLRATTFRASPALVRSLLLKHGFE